MSATLQGETFSSRFVVAPNLVPLEKMTLPFDATHRTDQLILGVRSHSMARDNVGGFKASSGKFRNWPRLCGPCGAQLPVQGVN